MTKEQKIQQLKALKQINDPFSQTAIALEAGIKALEQDNEPTQGTCKDCRHYHNCNEICDILVMQTGDDFYCGYFEKARC